MKTSTENKKRILCLAALVFLLFTRLIMYYRLPASETFAPFFIAECVLFLILYGLNLFKAPTAVQGFASLAGCAAFGVLYMLHSPTRQSGDMLFPLAYFPVFLFLIVHDEPDKKKSVLDNVWKWLFYLHPAASLIAFIYCERRNTIGVDTFVLTAFILTAILYCIIAITAKKEEGKNVIAFITAAASIITTCLFLFTKTHIFLHYSMPVFWLLDLLILYDGKNPVMLIFGGKCKKTIKTFLNGK